METHELCNKSSTCAINYFTYTTYIEKLYKTPTYDRGGDGEGGGGGASPPIDLHLHADLVLSPRVKATEG